MISEKEERDLIDKLREKGTGVSKTEDRLARELRKKRLPYKRQERIGIYRVDFYIPPLLIVEVEGPYHEWIQRSAWDARRKEYLRGRGFRVYIFPSSEVYKDPAGIAEVIASEYRKSKDEKAI
jgi:very-short-patch-repair endonuclease